jgi:TatA/E family protein of Tat protein translocase
VSLGPAEILVIFVVALLVFGPTKLPEIGRQVGRGVREFRKFQQTLRSDLSDVLADDASDSAEPAPMLPPAGDEQTPGVEAPKGEVPVSPVDETAPPPPPPDTA